MWKKGYMLLAIIIILSAVFLTGKINRQDETKHIESEAVQETAIQRENTNVEKEETTDNYYGYFRITKFCPTLYYNANKYDAMPEQEADMMLGRIVVLEPDMLITYDTERRLGTSGGADYFEGNYTIRTYNMDDPEYTFYDDAFEADIDYEPDQDMRRAIGNEYFEQLAGVVVAPKLGEPHGTQYFYTLEDTDKLFMYSTLTHQYFLLERCEQRPKEAFPEWTQTEKADLMKEIYGEYSVAEFVPTKFFPALDSNGCEILPQEEAELMLDKTIVIEENLFVTWDNYRQPNAKIVNRSKDDYWIEKVEIQVSDYSVETVWLDEVYGICDGILSEELTQQKYVKIEVWPGYQINGTRNLPQLFLTDEGKILMYSMGEYFLLEKKEER